MLTLQVQALGRGLADCMQQAVATGLQQALGGQLHELREGLAASVKDLLHHQAAAYEAALRQQAADYERLLQQQGAAATAAAAGVQAVGEASYHPTAGAGMTVRASSEHLPAHALLPDAHETL